jgi:hypothetical protein
MDQDRRLLEAGARSIYGYCTVLLDQSYLNGTFTSRQFQPLPEWKVPQMLEVRGCLA